MVAKRDRIIARGKTPPGRLIAHERQAHLMQVVTAGCPPGSLAGMLHRWQRKRNEGADHRHHGKQFDEAKALPQPASPARTRRVLLSGAIHGASQLL